MLEVVYSEHDKCCCSREVEAVLTSKDKKSTKQALAPATGQRLNSLYLLLELAESAPPYVSTVFHFGTRDAGQKHTSAAQLWLCLQAAFSRSGQRSTGRSGLGAEWWEKGGVFCR